jgi:metallo-beta-lactamase class B
MVGAALTGMIPSFADAQVAALPDRPGYTQQECSSCAGWNAPQEAVRVFGDTYWVGTRGLGAILITSDEGHVLIDTGLPESAVLIAASIARLGFRLEDVRLILNSHAHYDHAGGTADLQAASGAEVAATAWSAAVLERGEAMPGDPQADTALPFPATPRVRVIDPGDTLAVGPLRVVAHLTAGHTPGGTTWSWRSCEGERCLDLVYADSQTPVSDDDFLFTRSAEYPTAIADFGRGFATLEALRCDILVTPHPGASGFWRRVEAREAGDGDALIDPEACRAYATAGRDRLAERIAREGNHR